MSAYSRDPISIKGHINTQLAVSAAVASSAVLRTGCYDVWCDIDVFIKVVGSGTPAPEAPNRAADLTVVNGYKIFAGNVITVKVDTGDTIAAIAGAAGTFNYHRVTS